MRLCFAAPRQRLASGGGFLIAIAMRLPYTADLDHGRLPVVAAPDAHPARWGGVGG